MEIKTNFKDIEEVLKKTFIKLDDFYILMGKKSESIRKLFINIRIAIVEKLSKVGKRLPDSKHLPLSLVLEYLSDYGITKEHFKNIKEIIDA